MGSYRAAGIIAALIMSGPAFAQSPGWSYSPLPGEGDRAALGCSRDSSEEGYVCLAVRCDDDFTTGLYVHSSRKDGDAGVWQMTIDREDMEFLAVPTNAPYGARFGEDSARLLDRLRYGTFAYLRHADDQEDPFPFISLAGSMNAISHALYYCAPRQPAAEQNAIPGVDLATKPDGDAP